MYTREIAKDTYAIGGSDRRIELFENMFPLENGITYNSHIILDEKTAMMDTVDNAVTRQFFDNLKHVLGDRPLDYLIVSHMEPDHCSNIEEIVRRYPDIKIIGTAKTFQLINQFYHYDMNDHFVQIKDKEELNLGTHTLTFYTAPMVHWPEVFFTFDQTTNTLYSADAFGTFGGFMGATFSDEIDYDEVYLNEARRYYTNIVGRYGMQVQLALKKVADLPIDLIAPLHGPVLRGKAIETLMNKYKLWSAYKPEQAGVLVMYGSMYGNTEDVAQLIAGKLTAKGIKDVHTYDVSKTHASFLVADAFRFSHLLVASPTYNMGIYYPIANVLHEFKAMDIKNRKTAIVANGSWAPMADKLLVKELAEMKNMELITEPFIIHSALKPEQESDLDELVEKIYASIQETEI